VKGWVRGEGLKIVKSEFPDLKRDRKMGFKKPR